MADVKFSFQCPGRMYAPAWVAPEGECLVARPPAAAWPLLPPQPHSAPYAGFPTALQKKPEEINRRSADMWSFAVLLWELVTREVPFADLSNMEIGMKVRRGLGNAHHSRSARAERGLSRQRGGEGRQGKAPTEGEPTPTPPRGMMGSASLMQGWAQVSDPALLSCAPRWPWRGYVQPSHPAYPPTSAS